MRKAQGFPVDIRTGWIDYSPSLRYDASQRIRSLLAEFASHICSVRVRISAGRPAKPALRRCDVEVMTRQAGPFSASSVGVDPITLVDGTANSVLETLRDHASARSYGGLQQRTA
jgi:hypothetical protein